MCGQFPHLPSWLLHKGLLAGLFDHSQKKAPELEKKKKTPDSQPTDAYQEHLHCDPSNKELS
jgi:hypothetical protein